MHGFRLGVWCLTNRTFKRVPIRFDTGWLTSAQARVLTAPTQRSASQFAVQDWSHVPVVNTPDESDLRPILQRARHYGITTISDLGVQTKVTKDETTPLLVRREPYRSDFNFWKLLLDYQVLYHGREGVTQIYNLLKHSGPLIRLDAENKEASTLWMDMLEIAASTRSSDRLIELLCDQRHGIAWRRPGLFSEVVGTLLKHASDTKAFSMCKRLREKCQDPSSSMLEIIRIARPKTEIELAYMYRIYRSLKPLKIYREALRGLWQAGESEAALSMHKFLVSEGDLPSAFIEIEPLIAHLARTGQDYKPWLLKLSAAGLDFSSKIQLTYELTHREMPKTLTCDNSAEATSDNNDVYESIIRAGRISDTLAARAFSAPALPFEFILNSLKAFGLTDIGPQTLRQIGTAAGDMETLAKRLQTLHEHGVDTGGSAYTKMVRKLCMTRERYLLSQVLQTDIHHDVFEDTGLQHRLLLDHYANCNWPKVNLLLAILSQGNLTGKAAQDAREILLQPSMQRDDRHRNFLNLALHTHNAQICADQPSLKEMVNSMNNMGVVQKADGWKPQQRLDWARFTAGIMQEAVAAGESFEAGEWRRVVARIGGIGEPNMAMALIYWVVRTQATSVSAASAIRPLRQTTGHYSRPDTSNIRALLPVAFQRTLLHWSLQLSIKRMLCRSEVTWQRCLRLFKYVSDEHGLEVDLKSLSQVIVIRCRYLLPAREKVREHSDTKGQNMWDEINAWRECYRMLNWMHDLWSTPLEEKKASMDAAFRSLWFKKRASPRPSRFQRQKKALMRLNKLRGRSPFDMSDLHPITGEIVEPQVKVPGTRRL